MAGYSQKTLADKLGIKPGAHILILNPPENYPEILGELPPGVNYARDLQTPLDFIQYFARSRQDLAQAFPALKAIMAIDGMIWISWPKKAALTVTDLDEDAVRQIGLHFGLVDVEVAAIDDAWSGLKFVYRREDRA